MKVILLTNSRANQIALSNKISKLVSIDSIIVSKNITKRRSKTLKSEISKVLNYPFELPFKLAWTKLQKRYKEKYPKFPPSNIVHVNNINDSTTINIIKTVEPTLIIVSGTNLIKAQLINSISKNCLIMNLHTGISPYVKGGPNCTNWCLSNRTFELIGNTIMKLDVGIDSGEIIATEQTPLSGKETLSDLHWKVMEHAHNLYLQSIKLFLTKKLHTIPQSEIGQGKTYFSKDWKLIPIIKALYNFLFFFRKEFCDLTRSNIVNTYPINGQKQNGE